MAGPSTPPPPGWGPPPPGWGAPPPQWGGPPPPGAWTPPPSYSAPGGGRTDPFAIVSLVASLAGLFFCFIGQVVGIVFGHIARSRIKRSGEGGAGLALAGIIIGYAEIAFVAAVIAVVLLVRSHTATDASPTARSLARRIDAVAAQQGSSPRSGDVVREAIRLEYLGYDQVLVGATEEEAVSATDRELELSGWRLEVHDGLRARACLYLPANQVEVARITAGSCPITAFNPPT